MKVLTLEERVARMRQSLEEYATNPEHSLTLEAMPAFAIEKLKRNQSFPQDMLLILEQIGSMKSWAYRDYLMIDWWLPCAIDKAHSEERCIYDLREEDFLKPADLLFFAYNGDAECFFYDKSVTPWKIVVCDGLNNAFKNKKELVNLISPCTYEKSHDALSLLESHIFR